MTIKFEKKTMTLNVSPQEMEIIEKLAEEKGVTKTGLVRTAIRFYQSLQSEVSKGDGWRLEVRIVDKNGNEVRKVQYLD